MSERPGRQPDDDGDRPISDGSEYWQTPAVCTSHPSPGKFASHSGSQGLQGTSPWASAPTRLLRPKDAAEYLALSRARVYELMRAGFIESIHIGSSRRIPLAALDDFVNRLRDDGGCHSPRAS